MMAHGVYHADSFGSMFSSRNTISLCSVLVRLLCENGNISVDSFCSRIPHAGSSRAYFVGSDPSAGRSNVYIYEIRVVNFRSFLPLALAPAMEIEAPTKASEEAPAVLDPPTPRQIIISARYRVQFHEAPAPAMEAEAPAEASEAEVSTEASEAAKEVEALAVLDPPAP
ncbi:hypothetical protein NL676_020490 [Syzygium grande]|nr:hypothetical protein NL676_020490 [Syzygium grande]